VLSRPDLPRAGAVPAPPGDPAGAGARRRLIALAQTLIAGLLIWILLRQIDIDGVRRLIVSANAPLLAVSCVLLLLRLPLSGARWRILLERRGYRFSTLYLTRVIFVSQFAASLLPAASGADLIRGYHLFRRRVEPEAIVETMIGDRLAGIVGLIALSMPPAVWVLFNRPSLVAVSVSVLLLAAFAGMALTAAPRFARVTGDGRAGGITRSVVRVVRSVASLMADRALLARLVLLSMAFQLAGVAAVYLVGLSIAAPTSPFYYCLFVPLIWLWMTVPVSINAIGIREGAFVFYFGLVGMPPETALTIAALVFAQTILLSLAAGAQLALTSPARHAGAAS
jgi:uncharacterized protein (TIRG00374 family)